MKRIILSLIVLLTAASANAQGTNFEEMAKIKGVEYVHVGKDMIKLAAQQGECLRVGDIVNLGGNDLGGTYLHQLDDVKLFSCEEKGNIRKFTKTALNLLKGEQWEPLIDTKDEDGGIIKIYLSKNGEHSTNAFLIVEDEEAHLVVINGTFDLAKMMQEGMKGKVEVNN
ncbi:MAG: DUF4252 domain-containing protein [Prevotella sp.]|nr:DUF4252 domain-containing protein [Prevotella sp.]